MFARRFSIGGGNGGNNGPPPISASSFSNISFLPPAISNLVVNKNATAAFPTTDDSDLMKMVGIEPFKPILALPPSHSSNALPNIQYTRKRRPSADILLQLGGSGGGAVNLDTTAGARKQHNPFFMTATTTTTTTAAAAAANNNALNASSAAGQLEMTLPGKGGRKSAPPILQQPNTATANNNENNNTGQQQQQQQKQQQQLPQKKKKVKKVKKEEKRRMLPNLKDEEMSSYSMFWLRTRAPNHRESKSKTMINKVWSEVFDLLDVDKTKLVDSCLIPAVFKALKVELPRPVERALIKQYSRNRYVISRDDFIQLMKNSPANDYLISDEFYPSMRNLPNGVVNDLPHIARSYRMRREISAIIFSMIDFDDNGVIEVSEIHTALSRLTVENQQRMRSLIKYFELSAKSNGKLDPNSGLTLEEFIFILDQVDEDNAKAKAAASEKAN